MTKKPAPKKKPGRATAKKPFAQVADKKAMRNLRRVISHALASGLRNVLRFDVVLTGDQLVDPHYAVTVEFIDKYSKGKWR